jgi:hypothetical protein
MKTSPSIENKGDHSIPRLRNPRHERFAQELATGKRHADPSRTSHEHMTPKIEMLVGTWYVDEFGNQAREIRALD